MMNKDEVGGNWKQFKGKVKEQWGKLTDDDMTKQLLLHHMHQRFHLESYILARLIQLML